ncbi:MAG TPA: hypothetical protein PLO65_08470 [Caulobacter sp.]|nr:hypothetical protein [Caulobacter sp.]
MKPKKPTLEDEDQSRRFLEAARALEADGGLNPTEGEAAFEQLLKGAAPARLPEKKPDPDKAG